MATLRTSQVIIEVVSRPPPVPSNADLDLSLADLALASSGSAIVPGNPGPPDQAARVARVVIEVVSVRHATQACDCVITPQPAPAKYLMRRAARFR